MQFMIAFRAFTAVGGDLTHCMQHGCVVAPAKEFADFGQAFLREFFGEIHGDLAWPGTVGRTLFRIHVGHFDIEKIGHRLLNILDRNLPVVH